MTAAMSDAALAPAADWRHDLFVVHDEGDRAFVDGYLLPGLDLPPGRVLLSSKLPLAEIRMDALVRGVETSARTIAVLSQGYLANRWAEFAHKLASHRAGISARLIPLLLEPCEVPPELDIRVVLDLTNPASWNAEIARLRGVLALPEPARIELDNPFPGLAAFSATTAAQFFGRDSEIADMLAGIASGRRELYVIGPSGSGKSSLLAAGLGTCLERGDQRVGAPYRIRRLRPGAAPVAALLEALGASSPTPAGVTAGVTACLAGAPAPGRLAIVIDQLEELFTQAPADQLAGVAAVLRVLRADTRCVLVYALRADFYGHLMASELWADAGAAPWQVSVPPLRGERLREAITRPLAKVVWRSPDGTRTGTVACHADPRLIDRIVRDAAQEPCPLPLVQKTMEDMWSQRCERFLPLAPYAARGGDEHGRGLVVAFEHSADATIARLSRGDALIARRILLRLVSFGRDGHDSRRRRTVDELRDRSDDPAAFDRVLDALVAGRLLVVDAPGPDGSAAYPRSDRRTVELAHESLMSSWSRYRGWIQERRLDGESYQTLEDRAREWVSHDRGKVGLLDRAQVADARRLLDSLAGRELGPSPDLAAFVHRSRAVNLHRLLIFLIAVVALAITAVAKAAVAVAGQVSAELQPRPVILSTHAAVAEYADGDSEGRDLHWPVPLFDCQEPSPSRPYVLGEHDGLVFTALVKVSEQDDSICARFRPDWDPENPIEVCKPTSGMLVASLSLPKRTGGFVLWIEVYRETMVRNLFADSGLTHSTCSIEVKAP